LTVSATRSSRPDPSRRAARASRAGAGPPPLDHANRRYGAPVIEHRFLAGSDALPETRVYERGGPRNGPPRPPPPAPPPRAPAARDVEDHGIALDRGHEARRRAAVDEVGLRAAPEADQQHARLRREAHGRHALPPVLALDRRPVAVERIGRQDGAPDDQPALL